MFCSLTASFFFFSFVLVVFLSFFSFFPSVLSPFLCVYNCTFFFWRRAIQRVGTLFCENPDMFEDIDEEDGGADNVIVRQAEAARMGGRMLCALKR